MFYKNLFGLLGASLLASFFYLNPFNLNFVSNAPKLYWLLGLIILLSCFWLIEKPKKRTNKELSILDIFIVSFFIIEVVSSISGAIFYNIDWKLAVFGTQMRSEGLILEGLILIFYLFCRFLTLKQLTRLLKLQVIVAVLISILGISQKFGFFPVGFACCQQISSTLINPSLLGLFLIFPIFLAFKFFLEEKKGIWLIYGSTLVLALFLTGSRACLMGLILGLIAVLILERKILALAVLGLIGFIILGSSYWYIHRFTDELKPEEIQKNIRIEVWKFSLINNQDLILGMGEESFIQNWFKSIKEKAELGEPVFLFDRVHNKVLEIFFEHGAIGLMIWFLILGTVGFYLLILKEYWILGGLISYVLALIFWFDSISSYLVFYLILAYTNLKHNE